MNMSLNDLVSDMIEYHYGPSVGQQFTDSFNGQSFEVQNINALKYILIVLDALMSASFLDKDNSEYDNMLEYHQNLTNFLEK